LKILAVASGGGHWVQLRRLRRAFEGHDVIYVTVAGGPEDELGGSKVVHIGDATAWDKRRLVVLAAHMTLIVARHRPDAVVTTGAAPGYLAVRIGHRFGARTAWIDSIANSGEMSRAGRLAGKHADLWLTQWEHLAGGDGPSYLGSVL
jgi:hypothetical protein